MSDISIYQTQFLQGNEQGRRLGFALAPQNLKMTIFETQTGERSGKCKWNDTLQTVGYNTIPDIRVPFYKEAKQVYLNLQSKVQTQDVGGTTTHLALLESSKAYLDLIFNHALKSQTNVEESSLFSSLYSIWFLVHIIHIESNEGDSILFNIEEWMRRNAATELSARFNELQHSRSTSVENTSYWTLIYSLTLRGYFEPAKLLLSKLDHYNSNQLNNPINVFCYLIDQYPKITDYENDEMFFEEWNKWNELVRDKVDIGTYSNVAFLPVDKDQFITLFEIISGQQDVILKYSSNWQDALNGLLKYVYPTHDKKHLPELLKFITSKFKPDNFLDQILFSFMENDYPKAIALCTNLDWWLTTHLIDLLIKLDIPINLQLNHNGKLLLEHDKTNGKSITNLTEWYLINFAESLLIHDQLWKDALDYLVSCPNVDLAAIESIISRIPLTYQSNIDHLLQFCDAHSLHQSKKSILKILGKQCMDRKDYIPSIKYFVSAGDYFHVSLIVDMILTSYIQTGSFDFPTASLLPIPNEAQWRRLTFLIRFDQFQGYLKFKQYELAAKEIIPLFNSEIIPNFFFNTFLVDILPLLEGDFCLFSSVELIDLMRCLESFTVKNQMDNMDSSKNMLNLVRLALTRSLSSAYAVER